MLWPECVCQYLSFYSEPQDCLLSTPTKGYSLLAIAFDFTASLSKNNVFFLSRMFLHNVKLLYFHCTVIFPMIPTSDLIIFILGRFQIMQGLFVHHHTIAVQSSLNVILACWPLRRRESLVRRMTTVAFTVSSLATLTPFREERKNMSTEIMKFCCQDYTRLYFMFSREWERILSIHQWPSLCHSLIGLFHWAGREWSHLTAGGLCSSETPPTWWAEKRPVSL